MTMLIKLNDHVNETNDIVNFQNDNVNNIKWPW